MFSIWKYEYCLYENILPNIQTPFSGHPFMPILLLWSRLFLHFYEIEITKLSHVSGVYDKTSHSRKS